MLMRGALQGMRGSNVSSSARAASLGEASPRKLSACAGKSLRSIACANASMGCNMGRGISAISNVSRRGLALEMSECLDDLDFGLSSSGRFTTGSVARLSSRVEVRRSEVKSDRKRWSEAKAAPVAGGRAAEILAARLRPDAPSVAKIVTRAQHSKECALSGSGASTSKRTR